MKGNVDRTPSVLPFSKLNKMFIGYFDPENMFLDNENKYFWGELTDNSAKKAALIRNSFLRDSTNAKAKLQRKRIVFGVS